MTTQTQTVTEFLQERLTEDLVKASWREWHTSECDTIPNASGYSYPCDCKVPERMKREVEAKRRIVAIAQDQIRLGEQARGWDNWRDMALQNLSALASVYADHPDYRPDWA